MAAMKSLWDERARAGMLQRAERLTPQTPALWGRMTAGEMLAHLVQGMRLGLGEMQAQPRRSPCRAMQLPSNMSMRPPERTP